MRRCLSLTLLLATLASAAETKGPYARLTLLEPKEGHEAAFEDGYRRHLAWHKANGDRWAWYGWTIVTGPRDGTFLDGTFDRTGEELNAPVAPAKDGEDNDRNVFPHVRLLTTGYYRLRPELSRGSGALLKSPRAAFATVQVLPGREKAFEAALAGLKVEQRRVYQLINGGDLATYVVFVPAAKVSELLERPVIPSSSAIASARIEAVSFRSDLSYDPPAATPSGK